MQAVYEVVSLKLVTVTFSCALDNFNIHEEPARILFT